MWCIVVLFHMENGRLFCNSMRGDAISDFEVTWLVG